MSRTRKNKSYLKGWSRQQPSTHQRTVMMRKCGRKCFLGPNKSFPICTKNTCKVNKRGVQAAYIRAKEYVTIKRSRKYRKIAHRAYNMLHK